MEKEYDTLLTPQRDGVPCMQFVPGEALPSDRRYSDAVIFVKEKVAVESL